MSIYIYDICVKSSAKRGIDFVKNATWPKREDNISVIVLKNVAYKISMLALCVFSAMEIIAKIFLSLSACGISLIASPLEFILKTPFSLLFDQKLPILSVSNMIYNFAKLVSQNNTDTFCACSHSFHCLVFRKNNLIKGF